MRTFLRSWVVGAMVLGSASTGHAMWCEFQGGIHHRTPECPDAPGYKGNGNLWVTQTRIQNVCGASDPINGIIDVNVVYPHPGQIAAGDQLGVALFMHGGGTQSGFSDLHDSDSPPNAAHWANPYEFIADSLASKGMVVVMPIYQNQEQPYDEAITAATVATCFGNRVSGPVGPGPDLCTGSSQYPCFTDLVDKVAWTPTTKSNLIYIGHSAGGVTGLYVPDQYGSALKGLIMIDPDKSEWQGTVPQKIASAAMPIVHLYPDFFGPHRGTTPSELFRVGAPSTCTAGTKTGLGCRTHADCDGATTYGCTGPSPNAGAWVPLGLRHPGCDPNTGCHKMHHCTGFTDEWSYLYDSSHMTYCDLSNNSSSCVKAKVECGGQLTTCGQLSKCINGPANNTQLTWEAATPWILTRYVTAYAACLGAEAGPYYQDWVNGVVRTYEDLGWANGVCTKRGELDTVCYPQFTSRGVCESNYEAYGCVWSQNYDAGVGNGKTVRINSGQTVNEYTDSSTTHRYYGTYEKFNVHGAGSFVEQNEKLSTTGSAGITCQSGIVSF